MKWLKNLTLKVASQKTSQVQNEMGNREEIVLFPSKRVYEPTYSCFLTLAKMDDGTFKTSVYMTETDLGRCVISHNLYSKSRDAASSCFNRCLGIVKDAKKEFADTPRKQAELSHCIKIKLQDVKGDIIPPLPSEENKPEKVVSSVSSEHIKVAQVENKLDNREEVVLFPSKHIHEPPYSCFVTLSKLEDGNFHTSVCMTDTYLGRNVMSHNYCFKTRLAASSCFDKCMGILGDAKKEFSNSSRKQAELSHCIKIKLQDVKGDIIPSLPSKENKPEKVAQVGSIPSLPSKENKPEKVVSSVSSEHIKVAQVENKLDNREEIILFPSKRIYESTYSCFVALSKLEDGNFHTAVYMTDTYLGRNVMSHNCYFKARSDASSCFDKCMDILRDAKKEFSNSSRKQAELSHYIKIKLQDVKGDIKSYIGQIANYLDQDSVVKRDSLASENILYIPSERPMSKDLTQSKGSN